MSADDSEDLGADRLHFQLQLQASQLQRVLGRHDQPATIIGGRVEQRSLLFELRSHVTDGFKRLKELRNDLKSALHVSSIRLFNEEGNIQLQVLRPFVPAVPMLELLARLPVIPPVTAVLGLAEDGTPMFHSFTSELSPNILVSGEPAAGKTFLLRSIATSLALTNRQANVQLVAIIPVSGDHRRHEAQKNAWQPLSYLPHMLAGVAMRQTEITDLLLFLVRELDYRSEHDFHVPHIVILIDQAATLLERGGRIVAESILRLAQQGPEAGIHLVVSTRRPQAAAIGPNLFANLQAHYIGQSDGTSSDISGDGIANIPLNSLLGEGDFLGPGRHGMIRFQSAYIDDYDLYMSLTRLYSQRAVLLARPISSRLELDKKVKETNPTTKQFSFVDGLVSVN
ncbi:MAG: hypothetical protein GWP61_15235 [Chloroflexi bacterium]|jgi:DNA segregation ATPase FtsK/SpoIIIE-like protein|nr:hypothetical protein [Chloroflexota bacterium]